MSIVNPTQEQLSILKEHYKDIILNWPDGYDFCEVCLIKEGMQQDDLIFCELCNGLIHQSCYGGELLESIPEREEDADEEKKDYKCFDAKLFCKYKQIDDWYCERCTEYIKDYINSEKLHDKSTYGCHFCPEQKGIIKKITIQRTGAQIWSHVGCVASIKSLNFVDSTRQLIVQKFSPKKTTDECRICGFKMGNCGICHTSGCSFSFHFSCGKRLGIIQDVTVMNTLMECRERQFKNSEPDHHVVFCEEHLYNLSYVEFPEDKFLKEFIQNMYIQRETFDAEGENLSSLMPGQKKCDTITHDRNQLYSKYYGLYQMKKAIQKKNKGKGSSSSLPQSKQNISSSQRENSRSRSRSPPSKSDRKTAGGKKARTSQTQLDSEKESSKKPAQKQKGGSQVASKAPGKGKKEEELPKSNQQHPSQGSKSKGATAVAGVAPIIPSVQAQNDKNNKSKGLPTTGQQPTLTQQKNEQPTAGTTSVQPKKVGKRGRNDEDSNSQLIENQDNWRRIQSVMQRYDYREKLQALNANNGNNIEEQKQSDDNFKTPFHILEELKNTLPKRTTVEVINRQSDNENKLSMQDSIAEERKLITANNYDDCSNSEIRDSSSNMMQMIELDSTVLDQDKIIEEQKQSELQANYNSNSVQKSSVKSMREQSKANKESMEEEDLQNEGDSKEQQAIAAAAASKKLQALQNKITDDDKSRIYKRFIMEYIKLNRSKLHGPQSLYIIHPEMMQIMQIQAAYPQRKWKKEIAHYFVQKECLNPISKEVQIKKCINQRIIDLFSDRNIPTNIPSKSFYKMFKTHFMIKVYDNAKQLQEFDDISDNNEIVIQTEASDEQKKNDSSPSSNNEEKGPVSPQVEASSTENKMLLEEKPELSEQQNKSVADQKEQENVQQTSEVSEKPQEQSQSDIQQNDQENKKQEPIDVAITSEEHVPLEKTVIPPQETVMTAEETVITAEEIVKTAEEIVKTTEQTAIASEETEESKKEVIEVVKTTEMEIEKPVDNENTKTTEQKQKEVEQQKEDQAKEVAVDNKNEIAVNSQVSPPETTSVGPQEQVNDEKSNTQEGKESSSMQIETSIEDTTLEKQTENKQNVEKTEIEVEPSITETTQQEEKNEQNKEEKQVESQSAQIDQAAENTLPSTTIAAAEEKVKSPLKDQSEVQTENKVEETTSKKDEEEKISNESEQKPQEELHQKGEQVQEQQQQQSTLDNSSI